MKQYAYGYRLRPPGPGCQPMNGLISISHERICVKGFEYCGYARYNRKLSHEERYNYEMDYLGEYGEGKIE